MIQHYDNKDVFKYMFGETIQKIMKVELDIHLRYVKYDKSFKKSGNHRNETSCKTLMSSVFVSQLLKCQVIKLTISDQNVDF